MVDVTQADTMNTTLRSILSSIAGLAILGFTVYSAFSAGFDSTNVVLGIAGLTLWSLAQLVVLDFSATPVRRPLPEVRYAPVRVSARVHRSGVPALIEFPRDVATRHAA
jgi:uncharacterized protein (DUF58 family)